MQKIPPIISCDDGPFPFQAILRWYKKHWRHDLPWRQVYGAPIKDRLYRVWIAEIMLQQTQVDRVVDYYKRFLIKYPSIASLAETTYEELFPYWQGLGYYSRARGIIKLAKVLKDNYGGIFPDDFEKLRKLPWIWEYTAQAILAFWYDRPILAIDANLQKIFARYYLGTKQKAKSKKQKNRIDDFDTLIVQLQKQVKKEKISGRDINNALMDFWAIVSLTYNQIDGANYPLSECRWFQTEGKLEIKEKAPVTPAKAGVHPVGTPVDSRLRGNGGVKYSCLVFLHENHKKYWSSHATHYEPFLIGQTGKDDRKTIQDYFSTVYDLEVSVRPSFGSARFEKVPVKLFHAQIQTGKISFQNYPKSEKNNWMKNFLTIL